MNIVAKSGIGIALTGVTATGGYFGWRAFNSSSSLTQDAWVKNNKVWFDTKFKAFKDKVRDPQKNKDLSDQWFALEKELSGTSGTTDYEVARKLQEWCKATNTENKFPKVKDECATLV